MLPVAVSTWERRRVSAVLIVASAQRRQLQAARRFVLQPVAVEEVANLLTEAVHRAVDRVRRKVVAFVHPQAMAAGACLARQGERWVACLPLVVVPAGGRELPAVVRVGDLAVAPACWMLAAAHFVQPAAAQADGLAVRGAELEHQEVMAVCPAPRAADRVDGRVDRTALGDLAR